MTSGVGQAMTAKEPTMEEQLSRLTGIQNLYRERLGELRDLIGQIGIVGPSPEAVVPPDMAGMLGSICGRNADLEECNNQLVLLINELRDMLLEPEKLKTLGDRVPMAQPPSQ